MADIQKGVPSERIKGAALLGAFLGVLAGNGIVLSGAAGLSAAYLAIVKGLAGDVFRTVGGITWDVTDTTLRLAKIVVGNEKLNVLSNSLVQKTVEALQNAQAMAQDLDLKRLSSEMDASEVEAAEQAFIDSQEDLARVLQEAEAVIDEADQAIAKAQAAEAASTEDQSIDVSIPYDAAAELAFENSGDKSIPFSDFKVTYLAEAIESVKSKQPISVPYNAAAALAFEYSDRDIPFSDFKANYLVETVELVKSKHIARLKAQEETRLEAERLAEEEKMKGKEEEARRLEAARMEAERIALEEKVKAEEEEARRLEAERMEAERIALEEKVKAEEEEARRLEAERMAAEEEDNDEDDEDFMDEDDFMTAIELAQDGMEGKIVGADEIINDNSAKAEWDAAGTLARELRKGEDYSDGDERRRSRRRW